MPSGTSAEMKISPSVSVPLRLKAMVSTCMSSVSALMRLHAMPSARRCRLIRRAISQRDTSHGIGDAARNTPRKISDAASILTFSVVYQKPAAAAATITLRTKWTVEERNFFKDTQLLPYDCYTGIIP